MNKKTSKSAKRFSSVSLPQYVSRNIYTLREDKHKECKDHIVIISSRTRTQGKIVLYQRWLVAFEKFSLLPVGGVRSVFSDETAALCFVFVAENVGRMLV